MCVGCKYGIYARFSGSGHTVGLYEVLVSERNGNTICYNDVGPQSVNRLYYDPSLIRRYRSCNGNQNHSVFPYRDLSGVN